MIDEVLKVSLRKILHPEKVFFDFPVAWKLSCKLLSCVVITHIENWTGPLFPGFDFRKSIKATDFLLADCTN